MKLISLSKLLFSLPCLGLLIILFVNTPSCNGIQKLCGSKLNEALSVICGNRYGNFPSKKSIEPEDYRSDFEDENALEPFPFMSNTQSESLTKTRRRRLGIADECCEKACTIPELKTYCRL